MVNKSQKYSASTYSQWNLKNLTLVMCQRLKDDTLAKGGEISQIKIKKNKVK